MCDEMIEEEDEEEQDEEEEEEEGHHGKRVTLNVALTALRRLERQLLRLPPQLLESLHLVRVGQLCKSTKDGERSVKPCGLVRCCQ
jgi:ribosomal 50S subunit-associated protein YjgA (DUF615 family)